MKQDRIIAELGKMTDERLFEYDGTTEYKTTPALYSAGIGCCCACGYMQPIELYRCKKCGEEFCYNLTRPEKVKLNRQVMIKPTRTTKRIKKHTYQ